MNVRNQAMNMRHPLNNTRCRFWGCLVWLAMSLPGGPASVIADESVWPTYRHDNRRSGVTDEALVFPLQQAWVRRSAQPPQTAWTGPAKWDAYSGNSGLQSMRNFDPCFYVTADHQSVYFGSSVDDAVHALDLKSGRERWVHFTGAAVRFPPTLDEGHAYFGSDDGSVYCCESKSGTLVWQRQAAPESKRVTSNRKIISMWPVRTGVLIDDGMACFAASLVPWKPSYLWKVDAMTGEVGAQGFRSEIDAVTLQGALLASPERLYVPQGRAAPLAFEISEGRSLGAIGEAGGVFCILTEDELLLAGPQNQRAGDSQIRVADGGARRRLASFSGTNRILVSGESAWIPVTGKLKMLDRGESIAAQVEAGRANAILKDKKLDNADAKASAKEKLDKALRRQADAWRWETPCPAPLDLIKADETLVVGIKDEVRAYSADTGKLIWTTQVEGAAHGLAVAAGRLIVSTDRGHIYVFEPSP